MTIPEGGKNGEQCYSITIYRAWALVGLAPNQGIASTEYLYTYMSNATWAHWPPFEAYATPVPPNPGRFTADAPQETPSQSDIGPPQVRTRRLPRCLPCLDH